MDYFSYHDNELYIENISALQIAKKYGTPCYVYSRGTLEQNWCDFDDAFKKYPHKICYAVKANSNIGIINLLARLGSGFDIVSEGELSRVLAAGGQAKKIVFSGVAKSSTEIHRALKEGIGCFNVESLAELRLLQEIASEVDKVAPISIRINPDVDAETHPYISTGLEENKFGVPISEALKMYALAAKMSHIKIIGIDFHIGSQLTKLSPFLKTLDEVLLVVDQLASEGIMIEHINVGGGLGVTYREETPPSIKEYGEAILKKLGSRKIELIVEPGRAIVANAGILLTRVQYIKENNGHRFAMVDAGMNDLLRPALYQAWQNIIPVVKQKREEKIYDIVGPVCETGDFIGKERLLGLEEGDLLAIQGAGAYGFSMSSNYNSRPRAAEILVDKKRTHLIRERESIADLFSKERIIPGA